MSETAQYKLSHLHALAILEYAQGWDLSAAYEQIWTIVAGKRVSLENIETDEFRAELSLIPPELFEEALVDFLEIAREKLDMIPVEIITAVPLSEDQLYRLQIEIIQKVHRQLDVTVTVDPSLLGGIRILVDNSVVDYSVKRKLQDIKQAIYEGVYQGQ